jgi:hypothetical protein
MDDDDVDPAILAARAKFEKSGRSLDDVGLAMGYPQVYARKSVWQFLYKTKDPRLSMLRKFASALNISISTLLKK